MKKDVEVIFSFYEFMKAFKKDFDSFASWIFRIFIFFESDTSANDELNDLTLISWKFLPELFFEKAIGFLDNRTVIKVEGSRIFITFISLKLIQTANV